MKWSKKYCKKTIIYNIEIEMKSVHHIESSNIIMYHHVVLFRCLWVLKKPLLFPFAHNDFICAWRAILYQFPSSLTIIFVTFMLVYFHFLQTSMLFFPQKNYKKTLFKSFFYVQYAINTSSSMKKNQIVEKNGREGRKY